VNGTCVCKPEWGGMWCEEDNVKGLLDAYHTGWNPLGTVVMSVFGAAIVAFAGMFIHNRYQKGRKGASAMPGLDTFREQTKGVEYPEAPSRVQPQQ